MSVPELTDDEADRVGMFAAEMILKSDDWEIVMGGYKADLKDARAHVVLDNGRRLAVHPTITVYDLDPISSTD